ncbi:MAG: hypothetical protein WC682_04750 [Parcubacteria group bacterium]|jgi:hydrogenase maturation protein HypF
MQIFNYPIKNKQVILALGAESAGNFSVFKNGKLYFSKDFGDLLEENNFIKFKKTILAFLKKEKITPDIILTDLHPMMKTTLWGKILAKKYKATHVQIQHHYAHIFGAIGEQILQATSYKLQTIFGIAMDGTGYGEDEKIWGGECFAISNFNFPVSKQKTHIERIGHLENQILLGEELAIREPARMLISILSKFLTKKEVFNFVKKYYSKNEFELLYNQLKQNFNCLETSSTGRVLDAISLLLGFCNNERKYKHEPIDLLEKNSTQPYTNLKPKIIEIKATNYSLENSSFEIDSKFNPPAGGQNSKLILQTTALFAYLIKNLHKDKHRLAATAQLYIAQGLYEIIKKSSVISHQPSKKYEIFAGGGIANNKIISTYLKSKGAYANKKIYPVNSNEFNGVPRGDAGLSFGQIIYFLLS